MDGVESNLLALIRMDFRENRRYPDNIFARVIYANGMIELSQQNPNSRIRIIHNGIVADDVKPVNFNLRDLQFRIGDDEHIYKLKYTDFEFYVERSIFVGSNWERWQAASPAPPPAVNPNADPTNDGRRRRRRIPVPSDDPVNHNSNSNGRSRGRKSRRRRNRSRRS